LIERLKINKEALNIRLDYEYIYRVIIREESILSELRAIFDIAGSVSQFINS